MAVSKLWPVTVRLATVLDYAANPEKTTKAKSKYSNADYQALRDVVNYVKDGKKTEQELFCQGINCNPSTAREQFVTVKEQFDKPDGIQAYHGYLSFKETDITPELAQHIGMEFANSVWGKRHQVLVTTHLNTEHLHCHFVINSVSFVDGKRCRETSWFKFYKEADRICEKYGISTIKEPERYHDAKHLTMKDKAGMPTRYNLARSALDEAIAMSHNLKQLEYRLSEMGYAFGCNPKRKYWTIKGKGDERPIRLYRLGDEYTKDRITQRLIENRDSIDFVPFQPKSCRPKQYRLTTRSDRIGRMGGLYGLYLYYSNSISNQKEILLAYAQRNNFPNPQFFTDDGFSGTTFDRPSFIQMENLVEQGLVDTIIVKDLSRFGRNYLDVGNYLEIKYPTLGVRFIAIQENVDTLKETGTEMMPFNNIFNEWYAAQTSKKIRAVWKNKAANGKQVSSSVPFGYVKNPQDKEDWLVDEPAADIVRKIYALCLDGRGPLQIAKQLEQEKVLIPSAYYASLGRKTRKQYTHPYAWDQKTVAGILANQQYTGCTVNFMTTTVSYKVHKTVYKPKDEWQIIPNTQPAIIDEDTWKRVQELRENRIRPTATGRTSLFSGKVFCADCGSKLHFCAAKSLNANQEHYRCANYKSGRGNCQIHYIRNVVLEKIVLEAINSLADFVRCYEPVFLYLMAQKDIVSKRTETNRLKTSIESGKRRIQDLDKLIERIYEDQVLGNISAERYARMSVNYENEQRELVKRVDEDEKRLACIEQTSLDLKTLLRVLRSSTAFEELTPTLVNSLIRRIEVHNNDKSGGHCYVRVDIYFTAIGLIDIPTEDEIKSLMEKIQANPQEYRLTA